MQEEHSLVQKRVVTQGLHKNICVTIIECKALLLDKSHIKTNSTYYCTYKKGKRVYRSGFFSKPVKALRDMIDIIGDNTWDLTSLKL